MFRTGLFFHIFHLQIPMIAATMALASSIALATFMPDSYVAIAIAGDGN